MVYVPNQYDATNPLGSTDASTAAEEFRLLKSFLIGTLGKEVLPVTVSNSIAINIVFSQIVPANSMGSNRKLRLKWRAHFDNSTGGNQTVGIALVFGATQLVGATPTILAGPVVSDFDCEIVNNNATGVQSFTARFETANGFAATPIPLAASNGVGMGMAECAVDTTIDQTLELRYQLGLASALYNCKSYDVFVEWL